MANIATKAFADAIKSATNDANRVRMQKVALMHHRKLLGKVGRMLAVNMEDRDRMYFSCDFDARPYIGITLYNLESFKCPKIEALMTTLLSLGDAKATKDWAGILNRDYSFDLGWFDVHLSAYVRDDSPTCRKVVIGTELRQVDTYKIECD